MVLARRTFRFAAFYGVCALVPLYFVEGLAGRLDPPAISHAEYYYGFLGVALAWQAAYLLCAQDPVRFRPLMLVCAGAKVTWVLTLAIMLLLHRVPCFMFLTSVPDAILAGLFVASFARTPAGGR